MPETKEQLQKLVDQAVMVLKTHTPPDGYKDQKAISQFYEIFEGPASWKPIAKGTTKERGEPVTLSAKFKRH